MPCGSFRSGKARLVGYVAGRRPQMRPAHFLDLKFPGFRGGDLC